MKGKDNKDLHEEERMRWRAVAWTTICYLAALMMVVLLCILLGGCTTTKYVTVPEYHTEHHWRTDTVRERDTTHTERETVIREVDSAAMAKYGIQLQSNQRAWLVLQREMENRLRELEHMSAQRDTVRDSIPVPFPVEKKVPADMTWWQQVRMHVGGVALALLAIWLIVWAVNLWRKKRG